MEPIPTSNPTRSRSPEQDMDSVSAPDSTRTRSPEHDMESAATWSRLPDEILQQILARLPLPALLRTRAVCRHWSALTLLSHTTHPYFPVTIQGRNNLLIGYDHATSAWHNLPPLDFLPEPALPVVVAAAAGLLCLQTPTSRYLLCNPVTRTLLALPEVAPKWTPLTSVHILPDQNSFLLITIGKVNSHHCVAVYDSTTGEWRFRDADRAVGRASVVCQGFLYCGGMRYDIGAEVWQDGVYPVLEDSGDYQLMQMVECGGAVYMALARGHGGVGASGVVSSFSILKLEKTDGDTCFFWREVGFLGDEMLGDLQEGWLGDDESGAIVCVGWGSRICVAAGVGFVLAFNVGSACWSRLPACPEVGGAGVVADPFCFPVELRLVSLV